MSIPMSTAASLTTNTDRRRAPLAFTPARGALGACGTTSAMTGGGADAVASGDRTGDGFDNVWRLAKP